MKLAFFVFCFFWLLPAFGQIHLAIKNTSGKEKEAFYIGDRLVFELKGMAGTQKGIIYAMDAINNEITVGSAHINLKDIELVYSQKEYRNSYQNKLISAGILYPMIDQFNNMVIYKNTFRWHPGVLIASGGLALSGFALRFLKKKKYRLKNRFRLVFLA